MKRLSVRERNCVYRTSSFDVSCSQAVTDPSLEFDVADSRTGAAGCSDLGSKEFISAYFSRLLSAGEAPKHARVLRSVPGKELAGARFVRGSVKNVQMQVRGRERRLYSLNSNFH